MKPVIRMVDRIPHRGARRAVMVALLFAISLALGVTVENTTNKATLTSLHDAQDDWISTVEAMTPMALVDSYLGDVDAAMRGQWVYERPIAEMPVAEKRASVARAARCNNLPLPPSCLEEQIAAGSSGKCIGHESDPACAALFACLDRKLTTLPPPPECQPNYADAIEKLAPIAPSEPTSDNILPAQVRLLLVPFASIVHGITRTFDGGIGVIGMTAIQLLLGFAAFAVITRALRPSRQAGFGDGWMNYILGPISVIILGSVIAQLFVWLMLGALYAFSWITGLAAAAAGATGIIGGLWWAGTKFAEKSIEDAITKRD